MKDYIKTYNALGSEIDINANYKNINIDDHGNFDFLTLPFSSTSSFVYPKGSDYSNLGSAFTSLLKFYCKNNKYSNDHIFNHLEKADREIVENKSFKIPIIKPTGNKKYKKAIFLLHGLNEKHWNKYLPWALQLMEATNLPVILFPIAFHMNRAPEAWASPKEMMKVAAERKNIVEKKSETSFLNTALSHRLHFAPHRFFSSGMQTYYDIISFINDIKLGNLYFLDRNCGFDFFSYSIGATLTEVLISSNYNNYFQNSKAFLFCGGATLDTANPVSKLIMDKDAHAELFRWLESLFTFMPDMKKRVREIFFQDLPEVLNFKCFLFYDKLQTLRDKNLQNKKSDIFSLSLKKDSVFTSTSIKKYIKRFL